ncbi:hypothetical protein AGRO_5206 [Agrobacterium sp. ATCC 31749]|nr:hypothetical protein AGRO_5206 [Agrobacterium sp. ATCC 31749]
MIDELLVNAIQDWDFEVSDVLKSPNEIDAKKQRVRRCDSVQGGGFGSLRQLQ